MPIEIKQIPFSTLINGTRPQDMPMHDVQAIRLYRIEEFEKYKSRKLIGSDIFTAETAEQTRKTDVPSLETKLTPKQVDIIRPKELRLYEEEWRKTVAASNDIANAAQLGLFAENRKKHTAEESALWAVEDARHNKDKVKHELLVLEDLVLEQELKSGSSEVVQNNIFETKADEKRMDLSEKLTRLESDFDKRMIMRRRVDTFLTAMHPGESMYAAASSAANTSPRRTTNNRGTFRAQRSVAPQLHSPSQSSASSTSPSKKGSLSPTWRTENRMKSVAPASTSPTAPSSIADTAESPPSSSPAISPIATSKRPAAPAAPPRGSRPSNASPRVTRHASVPTEAPAEASRMSSAESTEEQADDSFEIAQQEIRRLSVNMPPAVASKLLFAASLTSPQQPESLTPKVPAVNAPVRRKKLEREVQDFETTNTVKYFASPYKAVVRRDTTNNMINTDPIAPHAYSSSLHHISNNKREAKRLEEQYLQSKKISTVGMSAEQLREMREFDKKQKRKFGIPLDNELLAEEKAMQNKQKDIIAGTAQKHEEIVTSHHVFSKTKYDGTINGIHMARKQAVMRDIMQRHRNSDLCKHDQSTDTKAAAPIREGIVSIAELLGCEISSSVSLAGDSSMSLMGDARFSQARFREIRHRVKKMRQSEEVELLLGSCRWMVEIVTMLKKQEKKVVTPTPLCCYMYLAILKRFLLLNFEFTKEIFYIILENCVPPSDFAVPIVHETLQLLREKVNIGPIEFHEYLLNNNYQPPTMLLKQVREAKKRLQRRNKILAMAVFSKRIKPPVRTAARVSLNQPHRPSLHHRLPGPRQSVKKSTPRLSIHPAAVEEVSDEVAEANCTPRPKTLSQSFVVLQSSRTSSTAQETIQSLVIEEDSEEEDKDEGDIFGDEDKETKPTAEEGTPWGDLSQDVGNRPIILPRTTSVNLGSSVPYFRGTSLEFIDEEENED